MTYGLRVMRLVAVLGGMVGKVARHIAAARGAEKVNPHDFEVAIGAIGRAAHDFLCGFNASEPPKELLDAAWRAASEPYRQQWRDGIGAGWARVTYAKNTCGAPLLEDAAPHDWRQLKRLLKELEEPADGQTTLVRWDFAVASTQPSPSKP